MMYMPDALNACVQLMEADPAKLVHRNSFNIASMSFTPEILFENIEPEKFNSLCASAVLEAVSEKFNGRVDIYKVNVDQEEELASLFNVRSIPTLLFIPMDGELKITQGAVGQPQLEEAINRYLL